MSGLSDSVIKDDALGLEVTALEEIVKAVEVKDSAKEANRTLGKYNGKINKITKVGLAMHVKARIMATQRKIGCRDAPTETNLVQNGFKGSPSSQLYVQEGTATGR